MNQPAPLSSLSDEALMPLIARGQELAFEELYRRHGTRLMRYFYRMLHRDEARAQDLLQDWCIRVVNHAGRFNSKQAFLPWAYTIAGNLLKNEYRRRSVRSIVTVVEEPGRLQEPIQEWKDSLDMEAFRRALHFALDQDLSPEHREVLLLRFMEELPLKDIALIAGCSEGTVKSRLFYALKKLSSALAAFHPCPETPSQDLLNSTI